ncbi:MAG: metallophosphatase family protein [Acidobacteria bacterium]|nr:metallophosphatase family protein [Acidobacteriota bacterium]|tara:strand:+ start:275 stop:1024 length:750 start_codon:yes stop_codon:yes gene_type:complete
MRFLILSDIHGNIDALDAVLERAPRDSYDRLLILGDIVGYGATPNEVVSRIFDLEPDAIIRGTHDKVSAGIEGFEASRRIAGEAARWTQKTLTAENLERVAGLPAGPKNVDRDIEICHGSPLDENTFVIDKEDAAQALEDSQRQICFFGHTHLPVAYVKKGSKITVTHPQPGGQDTTVVHVDKTRRYLVNPGSVGQPRDTDARASYATYDSKKLRIEIRRVAYRIDLAQQKISASGLPESLAFRLGLGR